MVHPVKSGKPSLALKLDLLLALSILAQRRPARTGLLTSFSAFDYGACVVNSLDLCRDCPCCLAAFSAGNI